MKPKLGNVLPRRSAIAAACLALNGGSMNQWNLDGDPLNLQPKAVAAAEAPTQETLLRLSGAVRAGGDAGLSSWGAPWSSTCSWSASLDAVSCAPLPPWLQGRWRVTSKLESVRFPLGKKAVNDRLPGVRMVSVLPLPNIGNTPTFEVEYGETTGSRRAENYAATLEAFWPSASVLDASALPSGGGAELRYESPTRSRGRVAQSVRVQVCSSEGGRVSENEAVVAEVLQQDNLEQGTRGEYLVLTRFVREADSSVTARQRIAAFLQPTDAQYLEAQGRPVALYDYTYRHTRIMLR